MGVLPPSASSIFFVFISLGYSRAGREYASYSATDRLATTRPAHEGSPGSAGRGAILLGRFGQWEQSLAFRRSRLAPEPIGSAGQGFDPMPALGADSLVRRPAPDRL